jgi:hypothetical protein
MQRKHMRIGSRSEQSEELRVRMAAEDPKGPSFREALYRPDAFPSNKDLMAYMQEEAQQGINPLLPKEDTLKDVNLNQ